MFERFTDRARRLIVNAQEHSRSLSHNFIGSEHILLALITTESSISKLILCDVDEEEVKREILAIHKRGSGSPGHIPLTPNAKRILDLSLREALILGDRNITIEHLFLALTRGIDNSEPHDSMLHTAAKILRKLEFPFAQARSEVTGIATEQQGSSHSTSQTKRAEPVAHRLISADELKDELLEIAAEITALAKDAIPGSPNIPRFTKTRELTTRLEATLQVSTQMPIKMPDNPTPPGPEL